MSSYQHNNGITYVVNHQAVYVNSLFTRTVEGWTENPRVGSSILSLGTIKSMA